MATALEVTLCDGGSMSAVSCSVEIATSRRRLEGERTEERRRRRALSSASFSLVKELDSSSSGSLAAPSIDASALATELGVSTSAISGVSSVLSSVEARVYVETEGSPSSQLADDATAAQSLALQPSSLASALGVSEAALTTTTTTVGPPMPPPRAPPATPPATPPDAPPPPPSAPSAVFGPWQLAALVAGGVAGILLGALCTLYCTRRCSGTKSARVAPPPIPNDSQGAVATRGGGHRVAPSESVPGAPAHPAIPVPVVPVAVPVPGAPVVMHYQPQVVAMPVAPAPVMYTLPMATPVPHSSTS
jgi:hypothetical protein